MSKAEGVVVAAVEGPLLIEETKDDELKLVADEVDVLVDAVEVLLSNRVNGLV